MIDYELFRDLPPDEKAVELRKRRLCNCCQAVVASLTEDQALVEASAGFGGGMGNMEGPCGALAGAVIAAGKRTGGINTTRFSRRIQESFRERSGAMKCRELKGIDTGIVLCPCEDCVRNAVLAYLDVMK